METATDIERNHRIIALSQFVSSFFSNENENEIADFSIVDDVLISNETAEMPQSEVPERS